MDTDDRYKEKKGAVALFGGAFDPVHVGHVNIAQHVLELPGMKEVVFIPSARSPLKRHGPLAGDSERFRMLELALSGQIGCRVDDCELKRGGLSHTVDTVRLFREQRPDARLHWVLGADQFEQLDRWHRIETLAGWVTFLVVARPGYRLGDPPVEGISCKRVEVPPMAASSTEIRERRSRNKSIHGLVPDAVEAFILEKNLYGSSR
ncbi:MAG: nicotinate-nucleotide adenylyltransferase [Opitutales bacterium]